MKRPGKKTGIAAFVLVVALVALLWWLNRGSDSPPAEAQTPSRPAVSVRAVEARLGSVQAWVFAEGTVRSVRREYLTFENAGKVTFIAPGPDGGELRTGDPVTAGTVLAHQDQRPYRADLRSAESSMREAETQVEVAKAELRQARTDADLAEATFRRYAALLEKNSASQQEYDEAEAEAARAQAAIARAESQVGAARARVEVAATEVEQARVNLEETELRSPIDGVLAYLNIEEGYYFTPNLIRTDEESAALQSVPMVVIDPSRFEVTVSVPAFERRRIKQGQPALIATGEQAIETEVREDRHAPAPGGGSPPLEQHSGSAVHGEVFSLTPAISPGARAIRVKIRTDEEGGRLEDGMFVTVWIATEELEDVLLAPLEAFLYRDNEPYVFVVDRQTQSVELRSVTLGVQGFGVQQIVQGVDAGELLVTDGRFQLSDGVSVRLLRNRKESACGEPDGG